MNIPRIRSRTGIYQYVISTEQKWLVRVIGGLGVISVGCMVAGYLQFLNDTLIMLVLGPALAVIVLYFGINAILLLFYPGFDPDRHRQFVDDYWQGSTRPPTVAIFIPAAGEDSAVVSHTAHAAAHMDYPAMQVYILDDTPTGMYEGVAAMHGVQHINRPNSGQGKKSGNLNYALAHTARTDFVLVLDADFVPRPEMLREIIPYTAADIGIIQTPQHFAVTDDIFDQSKVAYGAGYIQREFYRLTQVARSRFGASICVGTNALYNRTALEVIGGYAEVDHSEDVNTGLMMLNTIRGNGEPYRIRYLPLQLAEGSCPDTYYGFYKQQHRWSTGSFKLVFSKRTLFSRVLRPSQKILYFSNCLYYLYTLAIVIMPLQFLVISLAHTGAYEWKYALLFLPQIITRLVIVPYVFRAEHRRTASLVVVTATAYTFLQSLYLVIIGKPLGWEATGAGSNSKNRRWAQHKAFVIFWFIAFYCGTLLVAVWQDAIGLTNSPVFLQILFGFGFVAQVVHLRYLLLYGEGEPSGEPQIVTKPPEPAASTLWQQVGGTLLQEARTQGLSVAHIGYMHSHLVQKYAAAVVAGDAITISDEDITEARLASQAALATNGEQWPAYAV